jgi:hypothetical protein
LFCPRCGKGVTDTAQEAQNKPIPPTPQDSVSEASKLPVERLHEKRLKKEKKRQSGLETLLERQAAAEVGLPSKDEVKIQVKIKPPPTTVKTVRDLILWEYAKPIAHAARFDGNCKFIMDVSLSHAKQTY